MKATTIKGAGALLGAVALAGSGLVVAAPAFADASDVNAGAQAQEGAAFGAENAQRSLVRVANAQGAFSFDQGALTSNEAIRNVFCKAAAAVCASLPDYGAASAAQPVHVGGDVASSFEATVGDMAGSEGSQARIMACSCASNLAGGGAVANAEVSGVPLAVIAAMAGA